MEEETITKHQISIQHVNTYQKKKAKWQSRTQNPSCISDKDLSKRRKKAKAAKKARKKNR